MTSRGLYGRWIPVKRPLGADAARSSNVNIDSSHVVSVGPVASSRNLLVRADAHGISAGCIVIRSEECGSRSGTSVVIVRALPRVPGAAAGAPVLVLMYRTGGSMRQWCCLTADAGDL